MKRWVCAVATWLLSVTLSATAFAQAAAPVANDSLKLALDLPAGLDRQLVETAIARELRRPLELAPKESAELEVSTAGKNRVRVRYTTPHGDEVVRTLELPRDPARAADVIALLSVNLARDQTSELLAALRREPAASDEPAAAEPAPPTPPTTEKAEAPAPKAPPVAPKLAPPPKPKTAPTPKKTEPELESEPFPNFTFASPLALYRDGYRRKFHFEFGLLYSNVGAIDGLGFDTLVLNVHERSRGLLLGGLIARSHGPLTGAQVATIYSEGHGQLEGIAASGLLAVQRGPILGVQAAALAGFSGPLRGGGFAGLVSGRAAVEGVNAAGAVSWVQGDVTGVTAAGLLSVNRDLHGVSAAGLLSVSRSMQGLSVSVINVADEVDGMQLGVVNVAREVKRGGSLGLISLARSGRIQPLAWTSTESSMNFGIKFVAGLFYSELGVGGTPGSKEDRYTSEVGFGLHFEPGAGFLLEPGVHFSENYRKLNGPERSRNEFHYRLRVGYRLGKLGEVFAGGGVRQDFYGARHPPVGPEAFGGVALF